MAEKPQAAQITQLLHRSDITNVVNSYFRALDEKNFDLKHLKTIFTPDAVILRPNGTKMVGPEEIGNSHRQSFARFEGTQHLLTGHSIGINGETATIRVNLVAMHLWNGSNNDANKPESFFVAGAIINGKLRRIEGKWKISFLDNTNVWRAGEGFKNMEQTDK